VRIYTSKGLERAGLTVTKNPPAIRMTERVNRTTGEVYPPTPEGIDVGFGHHHGKSSFFSSGANMVDDRLGNQIAKLNVTSLDFTKLVTGGTEGRATVGYLPNGVKDLVESKTNLVTLSHKTIAKQQVRNPDIKLNNYQRLPELFRSGLIIKLKTQSLVFIRIDNQVYKAAIKTSQNGTRLSVVSFSKSSEKEIKLQRTNGQVVREPL
jgi:hypothetical protein